MEGIWQSRPIFVHKILYDTKTGIGRRHKAVIPKFVILVFVGVCG